MKWKDMTPKQVAAAHFEIVRDGEREIRRLKALHAKEPNKERWPVIIGFFERSLVIARENLRAARRAAR